MACTGPTLRGMAENGVGSARLAGSVGDEEGARPQLVVAPRGTEGWGHQGGPACDEVPAPVALTAGIFSTASSPALASKPPPPRAVPHAHQPTWDTVGLGPPFAPHLSPRPTPLENSGEQRGTRPGGTHSRGACHLPTSTLRLEASESHCAPTPLPGITAGPGQGPQQRPPAAPAACPPQQMGHPALRAPKHLSTAFSSPREAGRMAFHASATSLHPPPCPVLVTAAPRAQHVASCVPTTCSPQCQSSPPQKVPPGYLRWQVGDRPGQEQVGSDETQRGQGGREPPLQREICS